MYLDDLKKMKTEGHRGIFINRVSYPLDAPALAFIKDAQGHTGKSACNKCTIVGDYRGGRVCFPYIGNDKRFDYLFRDHTTYGLHHKKIEPGPLEAEGLGTDMVMDFLIEPLHALDLGVVKKLLLCWLGHLRLGNIPDTYHLKLSNAKIEKLNAHLNLIKRTQPTDFNRPSREISLLKYWKGAELSCLLHYTGPVIFKEILNEKIYQHFLLLHVASTICRCKQHSFLWPLTKLLFEKFVVLFKAIYGAYAMSYIVIFTTFYIFLTIFSIITCR